MLINFSAHPFAGWDNKQKEAAITKYVVVEDMPFPIIDPQTDELNMRKLVNDYLTTILDKRPSAVHIMGEMSFTFQMIYFLTQNNIPCIASTTERMVETMADGTINRKFEFVKFRQYQFFNEPIEIVPTAIELSNEQQKVLQQLHFFVKDKNSDVFLLKGAAGTGKTSILKHLKDYLVSENISFCFSATTGKAAQVLEKKLQVPPATIYGLIYTYPKSIQEAKGKDGKDVWEDKANGFLYLDFNTKGIYEQTTEAIYDVIIIDEASMVNAFDDNSKEYINFGENNLLADIFKYAQKNTKIIFVGDQCQLPPVLKLAPKDPKNQESFDYQKYVTDIIKEFELNDIYDSLALNKNFIQKKFNLKVQEAQLTKVFRTNGRNGIIENAEKFRKLIEQNENDGGSFMFGNNVINSPLKDLPQLYLELTTKFGLENTAVLCLTNKIALFLNSFIKKHIFKDKYKPGIMVGDTLMVYKNCSKTLLKNGEFVKVISVNESITRLGFTFLMLEVQSFINPEKTFTTFVLQDFIHSTNTQLSIIDNNILLRDFDARMQARNYARNSKDYMSALAKDEFTNVLLVKLGYAITVNKAQGSEWPNVIYVNDQNILDYLRRENNSITYPTRAKYTAITRAKENLYIVNGKSSDYKFISEQYNLN